MMRRPTSLEICAGAGGQALGLEQAGFKHLALVEIDKHACMTLRQNRPAWNVVEQDLRNFHATEYLGVDLLAGGVPCPPFSVAGKQLGNEDERNMFPEVIRLIAECQPKAVMIENVRGLLDPVFADYRESLTRDIEINGYKCFWNLLNASNFGVPQLRPRTLLVALKKEYANFFSWPSYVSTSILTVGEALFDEMSSSGWSGAREWREKASRIAPTIVGGSKKHGGPDLGPTRSRKAWACLGVDGSLIANDPPPLDFIGMPRLTVRMASILQGFPIDWEFAGKKTPAYRQVGNAFPPPVAKAVGEAIIEAISVAITTKEEHDLERGVA
ncbi:MAG: DNA cytosine methyltransferase [Desulfitobacteriaceae bacterium]